MPHRIDTTGPRPELLVEKSLAAIWWGYLGIPTKGFALGKWFNRKRWFNQTVTIGVLSALALHALLGREPLAETAARVRWLAETGLTFSGTILGFMVAGFAIFATSRSPSLLRAMRRRTHDDSGLSYLKYNYFSFVIPFIYFVSFAATCAVVLLLSGAHGVGRWFISTLTTDPAPTLRVVLRSLAVLEGTWLVFLLVQLKSFIFNVYHVVMTTIQWDFKTTDSGSSRRGKRTCRRN